MNTKTRFQPVKLVSIGLLLAVIPMLLRDYIKVPDFFRGAMMGLGIGIELFGIILIARQRKFGRACPGSKGTVTNTNS